MTCRALACASITLILSLVSSTEVLATTQRTFVASNGNDANVCSLAQPCRGFARAITQTGIGGEIIVLDSAGYGVVTITQSVSIIAPAGIYAGITVFSGDGVSIGGSNIDAVLRGLTINGQGSQYGIYFSGTGGSLLVDVCNISDMGTDGIYAGAANGQLRVRNTVLRNNFIGVEANGVLAGAATGTLNGVHISGGQGGAVATNGARLTITDSAIIDTGGAISGSAGFGTTDIMVSRTAISGAGTDAFTVTAIPGTLTRLVADANSINNVAGVVFKFLSSGGPTIVYSPGNNTIGFNNGIVSGGSLISPCCMN